MDTLAKKIKRGDSTVHEQNDPKRKAELELPLICSDELKIRSFVFVVSDLTDDSSSPVKSSVSGLVFCLKTESVQSVVAKGVAAGAVSEDEMIECEGACCGGVMCKVKDSYCNL
ncbi:hypothetical protein SASPL_130376 [Salvia splendens]|uniref:Glyoxalase At5g48480-like N-terminal domain-containing protein n=1 Tax=Salvia splendens TaxID=180675 RepID=A0A8X8ZJE2_SALSN|nr:hypothetical protein SASPL_130376 [Salvia splendens]